MSIQQYAIEEYWPTEPWLEVYRRGMEDSDQLTTTGDGWGVGWEGGMIFDIRNIPVEERTVADLPEEVTAAIEDGIESMDEETAASIVEDAPDDAPIEAAPDDPVGALSGFLLGTPVSVVADAVWPELEAAMPDLVAELLAQVRENVVDGDTVYAYLDLYDGGCREVATLSSVDEREHGFVISGDYAVWKDLVSAEADVINLIMSGDMGVDGDMQKVLQYSDAAVALTEIAGETDSRFLF